MSGGHSSAADAAHADHGSMGHVVPLPVLGAVFAALLVFTFLTVAVTWVDLGEFNVWIALGIATFKAALVALYFMHLRYDPPFHALIFVAALVFLGLFLAGTLVDTLQYQPSITNWQ
jgi:cytochrome c oxidase subunit IV